MLKDADDPRKEPARKLAQRKWRNHAAEKAFKEAKNKPADGIPTNPEIAETIINEAVKAGTLTKAQTKFATEIRAMLEGHSKRNLILYAVSIRAQRKRLLMEKLRRLEARQALRDSWSS